MRFFFLLFCFLLPLAAQNLSLSGLVNDPTGPLAGVAVELRPPSGALRRATTDPSGAYRFDALPAGNYELTFVRSGFETATRTVSLTNTPLTLNLTLAISRVATTLEVTERADLPTAIRLDAEATGGTRLDLPVRDLPASLQLLTQQTIQERGARSGIEAAELAVGMIAGYSVGTIPSFTTRGFSGNNITIMRDGIRQNTASQSARPLDSYLFERMEVLKGPASVLYGEGAIGAAINIVSKDAVPRFLVDGLASIGSFGTVRSGFGINGRLAKNLYARADASYMRTDGYQRDMDSDLTGVSTGLRWNPTENLVLSLNGQWNQDFAQSYYGTPLIDGRIDPRTRFLNYNMRDNLAKSKNRFSRFDLDWRLPGDWRLRNQAFLATHTLDWRNFESYAYNPALAQVEVGSYFLIYRNDLLAGNRTDLQGSFKLFGRPLKTNSGFQYQRNDLQRGGLSDNNIRIRLDPFNPQPFADPGRAYLRDRDVVIETSSLFSEAVYEATSKLKLIGGIRFENINLEFTPLTTRLTAARNYQPTTGRGGVVYSLSSSVNVYGSFTRAVEPVTQLVSLAGAQQIFSLVPGTQTEIGLKGSLWRGRIDTTLAYFAIEKRDILTTTIVDGRQFAQQIGQQRAKGVEFSAAVRATRRLTIIGDIALTPQAEFANFTEIVAGGAVRRDGNLPPNVPKRVLSLWANQRFGNFDLSATLRHVGRRFADTANLRPMDHYTTFDSALTYRFPRAVSLALRGRNLTDALYAAWSASGGTALRLEAPRSVDLTLSFRF